LQHRAASPSLGNDFLQDLKSSRLQGANTSSGQEPKTPFFGGTEDDLDPVICRGMVECVALVLLEELEKCLPPWVIKGWEDFSPMDFNSSTLISWTVCSIASRRASAILSMSRFSGSIKLIVGFKFQ
jgi:hypothetical protein